MKLTLERIAHDKSFGVLSKFYLPEDNVIWTIEQDWENNQPNISCIPDGEYYLFPYVSPKYGECWILENESLGVAKYAKSTVPRFGCLIHPANKASQLKGCIGPGLSYGVLDGVLAVLNSRKAMKLMNSLVPRNSTIPHTLHITSNFPSFISE